MTVNEAIKKLKPPIQAHIRFNGMIYSPFFLDELLHENDELKIWWHEYDKNNIMTVKDYIGYFKKYNFLWYTVDYLGHKRILYPL